MNNLIRKIKKGEGPVYRRIRSLARWIALPRAPRLPTFLKPPLRLLYEAHFGVIMVARLLVTVFYRHPLFQARCASVGKNLVLGGLPFVSGHAEIHIGDDVSLGGRVSILSGGQLEQPKLIIKDRAAINWNVTITVSREVVIEEDALISFDCRISDTDGHPREADLRAQNAPVHAADIRPVRICRNAWIGNGSHIMKGVTVGEGAVIGANSVVISDVPAYSLAMGNPAEVYFRNFGRPAKTKAQAAGE
ncbi:MAG: acyltransferase [Acidobacteriia bacterium]|nr:acyltransferase [Terriglobia bacterium]